MGDKTGIEWTDATWNPIRGCSRVSEGCRNCYAEKVAARFSGPGQPYNGLARNGRWTGEVRLIVEHLEDPLRWKKPRRNFVNSMSDLFHEGLEPAIIGRILNVMGAAKQHQFQVLTKRPERMIEIMMGYYRFLRSDPLPNVWLGVSVEDQKTADQRIPILLDTPAAVRFISAEPLIQPIDLRRLDLGDRKTRGYGNRRITWDSLSEWEMQSEAGKSLGSKARCMANGEHPRLDWVIVGGESGPGARPFDVEWARQLIIQCTAAAVPIFVKQLGTKPFDSKDGNRIYFSSWKGGDWLEWPHWLKVRQFPRKVAS